MWPYPSLILPSETFDFAFMTGILLSSLLFIVSVPFCSYCTYFINELTSLDGDWVTALLSVLYVTVSSVVFSKVL